MSDTDSFIEEVSEEVRRDRLFAMMRRYGWIAVVAVIAIVGGAAYNEYQKAQKSAVAEATGDALINALAEDDSANRIAALTDATLEAPQADIVRQYLLSAEQAADGDTAAASGTLDAFLNAAPETSAIYKDVAELKALMLAGDSIAADERRSRLEFMAQPGQALALLASEQLALLDVAEGQTDAAVERLQAILLDASVTAGLRQRASQLIVALGGEPETLPSLSVAE